MTIMKSKLKQNRHFIMIFSIDAVILGGTHQENDYNVLVDQKDHKFIYDGCLTAYPALKNAKILKESVGLRPGRTQVRLEHEVLRSSKHHSSLKWYFYIMKFLLFREWQVDACYS